MRRSIHINRQEQYCREYGVVSVLIGLLMDGMSSSWRATRLFGAFTVTKGSLPVFQVSISLAIVISPPEPQR